MSIILSMGSLPSTFEAYFNTKMYFFYNYFISKAKKADIVFIATLISISLLYEKKRINHQVGGKLVMSLLLGSH